MDGRFQLKRNNVMVSMVYLLLPFLEVNLEIQETQTFSQPDLIIDLF